MTIMKYAIVVIGASLGGLRQSTQVKPETIG